MARLWNRAVQLALEHERRILWAVTLFPLLAVALIVTFKLTPRLYRFLVREDSLVEWTTAVIYLIAAGFAVSLVLHFWRKKEKFYGLLYVVLTAGMIVIALEEMSWGQRQLGLKTPAIVAEINYKNEFNFHNMSTFPLHEAYIAVGFYGAFSRLIASLFWKNRYSKLIELLTPPYFLSFYFLIPSVYYTYTQYLYYTELLPHGLQWSDYRTDEHFILGNQEPLELLLSFGFLLFTLLNWLRYRIGAPLALWGLAGAGSRPSSGPDSAGKRVLMR